VHTPEHEDKASIPCGNDYDYKMDSVPASLITSLRYIADIADGERAYAFLDGICVDTSGTVWLVPSQPIRRRIPSVDMVEITRSGDSYHIKIPRRSYRAIQPPQPDTKYYIRSASVTFYCRTWWLPWNWA
jgi:hypothetical protein